MQRILAAPSQIKLYPNLRGIVARAYVQSFQTLPATDAESLYGMGFACDVLRKFVGSVVEALRADTYDQHCVRQTFVPFNYLDYGLCQVSFANILHNAPGNRCLPGLPSRFPDVQ